MEIRYLKQIGSLCFSDWVNNFQLFKKIKFLIKLIGNQFVQTRNFKTLNHEKNSFGYFCCNFCN